MHHQSSNTHHCFGLLGDDETLIQKRMANIGSYSRAMTPDEVIAFVKKEHLII